MPDLTFEVLGVDAAQHGLGPLLQFKLLIKSSPRSQPVCGVSLQAQIHLQCAQRRYSDSEKEKLFDLFGAPDQWQQTLRNKFWTHAQAHVGAFTERVEIILPVQCTFDLNLGATKYFYALDEGEAPLIFLFSGTIFYASEEQRLQVQQIPWDKECVFRMPAAVWKEMMDRLFPNSGWLELRRDVLDELYTYRRANRLATWEKTIQQLMRTSKGPERSPANGEE